VFPDGVPESKFGDPVGTIMFADFAGTWAGIGCEMFPPCFGGTAGCAWGYRPGYRHPPRYDSAGALTGGGFNACFIDGHAHSCDSDIHFICGDGTYWDYE
ncbi:MAG: hypothetical protein KAW89_10945, partial [Armatimonadetes bacterium]|nr:hypothetical protein [Armatimonadota bacterium]